VEVNIFMSKNCNELKKQFINWKNILLISLLAIITTGCSSFSILLSGGSLAVSQNAYAKAYNAVDVLTIMNTKKKYKRTGIRKGKEIYC